MASDPTRRYKSPADLTRHNLGDPSAPPQTTAHKPTTGLRLRTSPYLPTPTELALLALYPALLSLGSLYALLNPREIAQQQEHLASLAAAAQAQAPSYFARKDNLFNVLFVKKGWAWITGAFFVFLFTHPSLKADAAARWRAGIRWAAVTGWWVVVTRWFFGPGLVDRGFLWTGGVCEIVPVVGGEKGVVVGSAVECKGMGGRWKGGHDVSGHVFLLVLGSWFLVQEVGWVLARRGRYVGEERSVVMVDGAVKGAGVEGRRDEGGVLAAVEGLGHGGRFAVAVVVLSAWMLLMTAIYFHTWLEKVRLFDACGDPLRSMLTSPDSSTDSWWPSPVCMSRTSSRAGFLRCAASLGFRGFRFSQTRHRLRLSKMSNTSLLSLLTGLTTGVTPVSPHSLAGTGTAHRPDMTSSKLFAVPSCPSSIHLSLATHSLSTLVSHIAFPIHYHDITTRWRDACKHENPGQPPRAGLGSLPPRAGQRRRPLLSDTGRPRQRQLAART